MPDYATGSYVKGIRKETCCNSCRQKIHAHSKKVFQRVLEYGPVKSIPGRPGYTYRSKTYTSWHMDCALRLSDLNAYEHQILGEYFKDLAANGKTSYASPEGQNASQSPAGPAEGGKTSYRVSTGQTNGLGTPK